MIEIPYLTYQDFYSIMTGSFQEPTLDRDPDVFQFTGGFSDRNEECFPIPPEYLELGNDL